MYPDLPFEFLVPGVAVSHQASAAGRERWRDDVRAQARKALPEGSFLLSARLSVTIYLFPQTLMQGDIDNRAKLILDAMNRTVYEDDRSIYRLVIEKFDVDRPYAVPSQVSDVLGEALAAQGPIVYINVANLDWGD